MTEPFKNYIQSLQADLARGNASEHTHRPALKTTFARGSYCKVILGRDTMETLP